LHYGFHAWAIYVVTGLSLAYYAYTRGMPLTIRSALRPLFGKAMWLDHKRIQVKK
jgi:choline-glycine betaine transporter